MSMCKKSKNHSVTFRPALVLMLVTAPFLMSFADLGDAGERPGEALLGLFVFIVAFAGFGAGLGCFGFLSNHLFRHRSNVTYKVMCARPVLSLVVGVIITVVGLGLLAIFGHMPRVQLLLMLVYLLGLCTFGAGACTRVVARHLEPSALPEELPGAGAHLKAGLILCYANAVVLLGTILFLGVILAGVGAALLGYFISIGSATAATMEAGDPHPPPPPEDTE